MKQSSSSQTTNLFLVRHGATEANEKRPYVLQGRGFDLPLSASGQQQATAVAKFLSYFSVKCVYTSPLLRAVKTAQAIAARHKLEVMRLEEITECNVGVWEGMDWGSVKCEYPDAYREFMNNPAENPYVGGETYADVARRVKPTFDWVLRQHMSETIVVVAHNIVNRVYMAGLLGLELSRAKDIRQANACVNLIRHHDSTTDLVTMNSIFHLDVSNL